MNVILTDHMVCPRCGPPFGLLLVAREVVDRRVRQGEFGCANCRDSFPVDDGFADMRPQPRSPAPPREEGPDAGSAAERDSAFAGSGETPGRQRSPGPHGRASELAVSSAQEAGHGLRGEPSAALRLAAALGVVDGPGIVIVWDGRAEVVIGLSKMAPSVEVVATGWGARDFAWQGVSAMAVGPALPFADRAARGAVIADADDADQWRESVRVLAPGGRVVAVRPSPNTVDRMSAAGCVSLVCDEEVLVAAPKRCATT